MTVSHPTTLPQVEDFLKEERSLLKPGKHSKQEVYGWLDKLLTNIKYHSLPKKGKRTIKRFVKRVTGYSQIQLKRIINKHKKGELIWNTWQKGSYSRVYTGIDIELLHRVDTVHRLSGVATKTILQREFKVFHKAEFRKLANISVAHIYNIRSSQEYLNQGRLFWRTKAVTAKIGIRKKPQPFGRPGFLRVDTVHQGDQDGEKGVYWINAVDEVTQMEFSISVIKISEQYLAPVVRHLIEFFPFRILGFHSDNGSEYINKVVAKLLNKLYIQQTKSRSRKTNDNALAEGKNGAIIRKHFGYQHIPATFHNVNLLSRFCLDWLIPYLNYHRPCGYATTVVDKKGKEKKIYKQEDYQTPYEKFKSLPNAKQYLKPGISFTELDKIAYAVSDTEFALAMDRAKTKMLKQLKLKR